MTKKIKIDEDVREALRDPRVIELISYACDCTVDNVKEGIACSVDRESVHFEA